MKKSFKLKNVTRKARNAFLLATGMIVAACSDTAGPTQLENEMPVADGVFHQHLRWANPPAADQFKAVANLPEGSVQLAPHAMPSVLLDSDEYEWDGNNVFSVSFYAVRGQEREVEVELETNEGDMEFLELEITEPTYRPDGTPIAVGDSVLITVTIDPTSLAVDLQPSGIQFGQKNPTELDLSYRAAGLDLNADGTVNGTDYYIENNMLGVWMQEHAGEPWVLMPAEHDADDKEFEVELRHFSGYAVSW